MNRNLVDLLEESASELETIAAEITLLETVSAPSEEIGKRVDFVSTQTLALSFEAVRRHLDRVADGLREAAEREFEALRKLNQMEQDAGKE